MEPKVVEILGQLAFIAEKLGIEAVGIWPQIWMVTFLKALISLAIQLGLCFLAYKYSPKIYKFCQEKVEKTEKYDDSRILLRAASYTGWLLTGIIVLVILLELPSNLSAILFPEATTVLKFLGK